MPHTNEQRRKALSRMQIALSVACVAVIWVLTVILMM